MPFRIDPRAEKMPDDPFCLSRSDVAPILKGAQFIGESLQDNDMERWSLTLGGQFLRQTGLDGSRFYVVPPAEAVDFLSGFVDERTLEDIKAVLSEHGIEYGMALQPHF